jgi:energy-coupling factor transporter ATP-binding protein EcfA2
MSEAENTSTGAVFLRADLHVHTHVDTDTAPEPDLERYIDAAIAAEIDLLAITDHNSIRFVRDAIKAAEGKNVTVVPGVEISTADGHLLALFDPGRLGDLESFATPDVLNLTTLPSGELRSTRSIIDLVGDIDARHGLAIPAHVDLENGICTRLRQAELCDLLTHPGLAGLEFARRESLAEWFRDGDSDPARLAAWKARQGVEELRARGLARLMSSDAHTPEAVGRDRTSRTLTRLRLGDANFDAMRIAIKLNPKARCKAETVLPVAYRRILSARFEGGFLDGASMNFSPNLNCLIGGRGSGKSTALLAIRAALGARLAKGEDPDDPDRPDRTTVTFIDEAGSTRTAVRERGERPIDESGSPIDLRIADLGQDESGDLARSHKDDPTVLLEFLDGFIVRHELTEREAEMIEQLSENAAEILRTAGVISQLKLLREQEAKLAATLEAAKESRIDEIAEWAQWLSSQKPLLESIDARIQEAGRVDQADGELDLDRLADEYGVDLSKKPVRDYLEGDDGLRARLGAFAKQRAEIAAAARTQLTDAAARVQEPLGAWKAKQAEMEERMRAKRAELEQQGLKVETTAIVDIARRLGELRGQIATLKADQDKHIEARQARTSLVAALAANRDALFETRRATIKRIVADANSAADELIIHIRGEWSEWLARKCNFRRPRVERLAAKVTPAQVAEAMMEGPEKLGTFKDEDGQVFFGEEQLTLLGRSWSDIFELQTMRLEDRPQIEVQRTGSTERRSFDQLSAGQQRSVLLSLILCAERGEPLVLDQPEDHLDGRYIADAVVGHLEGAKERRQVLIATHSANLVVLGDAELVIPMRVENGKGAPFARGAVDRPETRDQVCSLLEGGAQAYKKRGERYGFRFKTDANQPG